MRNGFTQEETSQDFSTEFLQLKRKPRIRKPFGQNIIKHQHFLSVEKLLVKVNHLHIPYAFLVKPLMHSQAVSLDTDMVVCVDGSCQTAHLFREFSISSLVPEEAGTHAKTIFLVSLPKNLTSADAVISATLS